MVFGIKTQAFHFLMRSFHYQYNKLHDNYNYYVSKSRILRSKNYAMRPKHVIQFVLIFLISLSNCKSSEDKIDTPEIVFIDHKNLRYIEDEKTIELQVAAAKNNIDQAAEMGADSYLLFAKETFEAILDYDFNVKGIGNIGQLAFHGDDDHYYTAKYLRQALNEILEYAGDKQIRLFFHSNQFIFPDEVLAVIKPKTWGTAVCPGREITWEIYRKKLDEFFSLFPDIEGFQITGDETQVSVLECSCDSCRHLSFVDRVNELTKITGQVCQKHGKQVQMRTWQRMGELEKEKHPSKMGEGLPGNIFFSIKNTDGDFHLNHSVDETFINAADPERVIVEFDAWREYEGNNYFPCYMGDIWAPRFRLLNELGIQRIAVRLNWNSNKNPIFEMPWGNLVNIYVFLRLAEDPSRPADSILKEFIGQYYPESAHRPAFALYKFSPEFQKAIYYLSEIYLANHSRVQDEDAEDDLEKAQSHGMFMDPDDFTVRRDEINSACEHAVELVEQLGEDVPDECRYSLLNGIKIEQNVALGTLGKIEAIYWKNRHNGEEMKRVLSQLKKQQEDWQLFHPQSYESMHGDDLLKDITD